MTHLSSLDALLAVHEPEESVVTLTLDFASPGRIPPRTSNFLRQDVVRRLPQESTSRTLEDTCLRIQRYVDAEIHPETRGLFLVAGPAVWEPVQLRVPLRNAVFLNRTPYLAPLLETEARAPRVYVTCLDRQSASLDELHLGAWRNLSQWKSRVPDADVGRSVSVRGPLAPDGGHRDRLDRRIDDEALSMIGDIARRIRTLDAENPSRAILVFGAARLYRRLRERLPSGSRAIHAGPRPKTEQDLCDRAVAISEWLVRDRTDQEVRQLLERKESGHLVALGPRPVFEALDMGTAVRAFVDPDNPVSGARCGRCRDRESESMESCPSCGEPLVRVSFTQELIARSLAHPGIALTFVPRAGWLAELGGLTALLRPRG